MKQEEVKMTSSQNGKTIQKRNEFLQTQYETCPHCQHKRIEFNQNWNKRINKQRELYQKQHFPQTYEVVCTCRISDLL